MLKETKLIGIHEGKYYKQTNGLSVGPGFLLRGFEYVTGKSATIIGKPNEYFFNSAIPSNISAHECCMIGDVCICFVYICHNLSVELYCVLMLIEIFILTIRISMMMCLVP